MKSVFIAKQLFYDGLREVNMRCCDSHGDAYRCFVCRVTRVVHRKEDGPCLTIVRSAELRRVFPQTTISVKYGTVDSRVASDRVTDKHRGDIS